VAEQSGLSFAGLLRQLRAEAKLTQEELAEAAGLSSRSISDLERGINRPAHKDTAQLLADALNLAGPVHELFVAAARGKGPAAEVLAARSGGTPAAFAAAAIRGLPRDIGSFTGRQAELAQLTEMLAGAAASGGVVAIHAIDGMAGSARPLLRCTPPTS
jgi:transcriptional regulator with XRE-family HTH domain